MEIMKKVVAKHTYPHTMVGAYIQPIEHNRACQIEFTFFYDPANEAEKAEIAEIVYEAGIEMMNRGAQFTRPYGNLVPVIYDRAGGYTATLKRVKNILTKRISSIRVHYVSNKVVFLMERRNIYYGKR